MITIHDLSTCFKDVFKILQLIQNKRKHVNRIHFIILIFIGQGILGQGRLRMSEEEQIPFMQRLLDSPLTLLLIGVMSPMILYVLWGVLEVLAIPVAS